MTLFKLFFGLLIGLLFLIAALYFSLSPEAVTGLPHESYTTMLHSGESVAAAPLAKWLSFLFGLCILGIFVICIMIGYRKYEKLGKVKPWLFGGSIAYLLVFAGMVFSYWNYMSEGSAPYFLGFPAPTAWMLYAVWLFPLFFTFIYIFKFNDWVITPEERKRFEEIKKRSERVRE